MSDKRQKIQLELAFTEKSKSEAPRDSVEGTETLMAKREAESMAISKHLMEAVCERKNCKQALARVKSNCSNRRPGWALCPPDHVNWSV